MRKHMNLYLGYLYINIKSLMIYRLDLVLGSFGFLLSSSALIFSLYIIFQYVQAIGGWDFWQILFLYSFISLSRAAWDTFMHNMINLSDKVRDGSFDTILLRPVNPLFQLLAEKLDFDPVGELIFSTILIYICLDHYQKLDNFRSLSFLFLLLLSSTFCFAGLHLITNTIAFWTIDASPLSFLLWRFDELARYPLSIYPRWLQRMLTWIVPYGFVGYYQVKLFLHIDEASPAIWLAPLAGFILFAIAYKYWNIGLERYESTGS